MYEDVVIIRSSALRGLQWRRSFGFAEAQHSVLDAARVSLLNKMNRFINTIEQIDMAVQTSLSICSFSRFLFRRMLS